VKVTAARLTSHGAPLQIEEVELPEPQQDEVLVKMCWGGVNPVDRYAAMGHAAADGPLPRTLGTEGSGIAEDKPVLIHGAGVGTQRDGLWATHAVVPRRATTAVPDGVDMSQAAAIGVAGATAWKIVKDLAQVTSEDRVLVLGASGGVGSMIVSFASSCGATVWGQTESASNREWMTGLGAADVIVSGSDGLASLVEGFSPSVVFDALGNGFTGQAVAVMALRGRLVLFGTSAGPTGEIPLQMLYRKALTVFGYAGLIATEAHLAEAKRRALEAVALGTMRVTIGKTLPLAEANDAFDLIAGRAVRGKVLLDLSV
jgi:NADPH2:quinone reductase